MLRCSLALLALTALVQTTPTRVIPEPEPTRAIQSFPSATDPASEDITCTDYKTCSSKGRGYWEALQATLAQAQPIDRNDQQVFERDYKCEYITIDSDSQSLERIKPDLQSHGINPDWLEAQGCFSTSPETGEDTEATAYGNLFSTSQGIIIAYENYRDSDEQKTLPWSEIIWNAWSYARVWDDYRHKQAAEHPPGAALSILRVMIRLNVRNEETNAVLRTIWDAAEREYNTIDQTWYKFTEADPATKNWFYAIIGTPNVKGNIYLLNDHAMEIGKKTVTEIWVRWPYVYPDIWINLGAAVEAGA